MKSFFFLKKTKNWTLKVALRTSGVLLVKTVEMFKEAWKLWRWHCELFLFSQRPNETQGLFDPCACTSQDEQAEEEK